MQHNVVPVKLLAHGGSFAALRNGDDTQDPDALQLDTAASGAALEPTPSVSLFLQAGQVVSFLSFSSRLSSNRPSAVNDRVVTSISGSQSECFSFFSPLLVWWGLSQLLEVVLSLWDCFSLLIIQRLTF